MTQASDREGRGSKDFSCTPLNIKMIRVAMAKGSPFTIGQTLIEQISLVAKLAYFNKGSTIVDIELEDETGSIACKVFKRVESDNILPLIGFEPKIGSYVYVFGSLMNFNGNDVIVIGRIRNIEEYEIVNLHRVQVVWAQLVRKRLIGLNS